MLVVTHKRKPKIGSRWVASGVFLAALCFLLSTPSFAHRVTIFAWVDGDIVHTESKTGGGKCIKDATVKVLDANGAPLLTGKTDTEGRFSFKVPQKTELTVVLDAAMGHRAQWTIPAGELVSAAETSHTTPADQTETDTEGGPGNRRETRAKNNLDQLTRQEMEQIVNDALDRRLGPLVARLSESVHRGPQITEIIGGIGYIVGIVGVVLYALSRKGTNRQS